MITVGRYMDRMRGCSMARLIRPKSEGVRSSENRRTSWGLQGPVCIGCWVGRKSVSRRRLDLLD
jgi:hypothetical protein